MTYSKIHAFIRTRRVAPVEDALKRVGANGFSFCRAVGVGEYAKYFGSTRVVEHVRLEVFVEADRAEVVVDAICEAAYTGLRGDGLVAVLTSRLGGSSDGMASLLSAGKGSTVDALKRYRLVRIDPKQK